MSLKNNNFKAEYKTQQEAQFDIYKLTYGEIYSIKNLADFYFPHHFRNLKIAYYHVDTYQEVNS